MSSYEDFQKYYEEESDRVFDELMQLNEDELLVLTEKDYKSKFRIWEKADNFQVWRALAEKGTKKSLPRLFEIVRDLSNDYLIRYHACDALFKIAGITDNNFKGQVQYGLDQDRNPVNQLLAIERLKSLIMHL